MYSVLPASEADGVKVTVFPFMLTVPLTRVPAEFARYTVALLTVESRIASEKVVDTFALVATPDALLCGEVDVTLRAVVSVVPAVVKLQL